MALNGFLRVLKVFARKKLSAIAGDLVHILDATLLTAHCRLHKHQDEEMILPKRPNRQTHRLVNRK